MSVGWCFFVCETRRQRTFVSGRVLEVECADPFDERLHASLLKDAHERRLESFTCIRGDLGNSSLVASSLLDVTSSNLLELEVSGNIGGNEDVGQLARRHEELGDKINIPVVEAAIVLPRLLALLEVSVLLEQL